MVSTEDFRNGMALLTGAVNVITTDGPAGLAGVTASAVCSVTDTPPTLLVCLNRASYAHAFFVANGRLCVNVLSAQQQATSALFADRTVTMPDRFAQAPWEALSTGAPALNDALVNFDAVIRDVKEVGTHSVFFAEVQQVRWHRTEPAPAGLAYFNRRFHALTCP